MTHSSASAIFVEYNGVRYGYTTIGTDNGYVNVANGLIIIRYYGSSKWTILSQFNGSITIGSTVVYFSAGTTSAQFTASASTITITLDFREYIATGLVIYDNRCSITNGGYSIDGDTVYVDITITSLVGSGYSNALFIYNFPRSILPTPSTVTNITPIIDHFCISQHIDESRGTFLRSDTSTLVAGSMYHFVGSYKKG